MQIKSPSMFDWEHGIALHVFGWEHGIALHTLQRNRASSCGKEEVSWFFPSCGGNLGYILELQWE